MHLVSRAWSRSGLLQATPRGPCALPKRHQERPPPWPWVPGRLSPLLVLPRQKLKPHMQRPAVCPRLTTLPPRAEQTLGKAWAQAVAQLGRLLLPVTHTATSRPPQDVHICTTFHVGKCGQLSNSAKEQCRQRPLFSPPLETTSVRPSLHSTGLYSGLLLLLTWVFRKMKNAHRTQTLELLQISLSDQQAICVYILGFLVGGPSAGCLWRWLF